MRKRCVSYGVNKYIILNKIALIIVCVVLLNGCSSKQGESLPEQFELPNEGDEIAIIHTNIGDIKLRLLTEVAPKTVDAFKKTISDMSFNGTEIVKSLDTNVIFTSSDLNLPYYEEVFGNDYLFETNLDYRHYPGAVGFLKYMKVGPATEFYMTASVKLENEYLEDLERLEDLYPSHIVDNYERFGGEPRGDMSYTVFAQIYEGLDIVDEIFSTAYNPITLEVENQYFIEEITLSVYK